MKIKDMCFRAFIYILCYLGGMADYLWCIVCFRGHKIAYDRFDAAVYFASLLCSSED